MLFAGWRADSDELLTDDGPTVVEALTGAARRGALVRGLLWRSHLEMFGYQVKQNRTFAGDVAAAGGEVLLDQRIRALGCHHQKLVVIRHGGRPRRRRVRRRHRPQTRGRPRRRRPPADRVRRPVRPRPRHDMQVELRGPAVRDVEDAFRERWEDPAPLARLPWHVIPDRIHRLPRAATPLPAPALEPPSAGSCAVQILRTYPHRRPPYPFAPLGERSLARAYTKALSRARRLVYIEDQYLWSIDVARIFAAALRRSPRLHLIAVVPHPSDDTQQDAPPALGQGGALAMVRDAGGDRVQIFDIENHEGRPIYVHAKVCIIDDVWATRRQQQLQQPLVDPRLRADAQRSSTTTATPAHPADPAGLGDGARRFARGLRLDLMREHLDLDGGADAALLDPDKAAETVRRQAEALDAWHAGGWPGSAASRASSPPRTRARAGAADLPAALFTAPAYRMALDPDGRALGMRLRARTDPTVVLRRPHRKPPPPQPRVDAAPERKGRECVILRR